MVLTKQYPPVLNGNNAGAQSSKYSLSQAAQERLASLLALGDPGGEVAIAYRVKERIREFYQCGDKDTARGMLTDLARIHRCRFEAGDFSGAVTSALSGHVGTSGP